VRHLAVVDWEKVPECDEAVLLGSLETDSLRRHGLFWPPALHTLIPVIAAWPAECGPSKRATGQQAAGVTPEVLL
jgi:hypothetical protein